MRGKKINMKNLVLYLNKLIFIKNKYETFINNNFIFVVEFHL